MRKPKPQRPPGSPCATTVVMSELAPGTHSYVDLYRSAPPILVIDTGPTEVQLSLPGDRCTVEDLWIIDELAEALAKFRQAQLPHMD